MSAGRPKPEPLQYGVERTLWLIDDEADAVYSVRATFQGTDSQDHMRFIDTNGWRQYRAPGHAYLTEYEALVALHGRLTARIVSLESSVKQVEAQLMATGQWKAREQ